MRNILAIQTLSAALVLALGSCGGPSASFESQLDSSVERPWIGPEYWANPLQDWRLKDGRIENFRPGGDRNVFLLTREVGETNGTLALSVRMGRLQDAEGGLEPGWAGFRVGIRGSFDDYRDSAVRGVGLNCGVASDGRLFIGSVDDSTAPLEGALAGEANLSLNAEPAGELSRLTLRIEAGGATQEISSDVDQGWLTGGLALVSSSGPIPDSPPAEEEIRETGWALKPGTRAGGHHAHLVRGLAGFRQPG